MIGCVRILSLETQYFGRTPPTLSTPSPFRTVRSVPPSTCPSDPPRIPAPPTSPQTRLKKTVQASVSQSTTNHSPRAKKLQTPVQPRIRTTPPPPWPFPALLSTHAHGHHKNANDHHKPIRPQSFGRPQSAPRPLSPSHAHAPRHATVKHAYLSPLGPPLLGAQVRLPLPPPTPTPPGTSEIFSAHPAIFYLLLSTPSALGPFLNPPPPPQGKSAFI